MLYNKYVALYIVLEHSIKEKRIIKRKNCFTLKFFFTFSIETLHLIQHIDILELIFLKGKKQIVY